MAVLKYKDSNNLWLPLVNYNVTTPDVVQVTGTSTSDVMSQKAVTDLLATKANSSSLATVATSGSYNDLSNKPSLATVATSGSYNDLTNTPTIPAALVNADWNSSSGVSLILNKPDLSNYVQKSLTSGLVKNDGTIDSSLYLTKPIYTAPTAKNDLMYTGMALTLLNAGTTSHGTILYSYDSITWSTTLPSKTNAGTYTVYWRLIGDSTHVDVLPLSIDVTIAKASRTITFTTAPTTVDIGDSVSVTATPSAGAEDGTITYSSSDTSVATASGSTITGISAGTSTITATITEGLNYLEATTTYTITVESVVQHDYVDLGLPSGTKWATMNVGAESVTDYGNYYMYGKGATQYNSGDAYYAGTEDPLAASADTATQEWGSDWHMPTKTQFEELTANTTYEWTTINGVNGGKFTAQNGNYVFFPAAGYYNNGSQSYMGSYGFCWCSSPNYSSNAYHFYCGNNSNAVRSSGRDYGYSVRPVMDA